MPDKPVILLFTIDGRAEVPESLPVSDLKPEIENTQELIEYLNRSYADTISEKLEKELKKLLPPNLSVQANMQFEHGSLIISGTVAIISWIGSTVIDAVSENIKQQLASIVKIAAQRVMNRYFRELMIPQKELSIDAYPHSSTKYPINEISRTISNKSNNILRSHIVLYVITGIVFFIQVLLLLDRFFVIQFR